MTWIQPERPIISYMEDMEKRPQSRTRQTVRVDRWTATEEDIFSLACDYDGVSMVSASCCVTASASHIALINRAAVSTNGWHCQPVIPTHFGGKTGG